MGKRSVKENKNIYQISREKEDLTREAAAELLDYISADRIEKIESEKSLPHPDEILSMAKVYKSPTLCNYYCSHECPIGGEYVPEIQEKELSQIVLEVLAGLSKLERLKNRLVEISVDGEISEDEYPDFITIQEELQNIAIAVDTLKVWMEKMIIDGRIDREKLDMLRRK